MSHQPVHVFALHYNLPCNASPRSSPSMHLLSLTNLPLFSPLSLLYAHATRNSSSFFPINPFLTCYNSLYLSLSHRAILFTFSCLPSRRLFPGRRIASPSSRCRVIVPSTPRRRLGHDAHVPRHHLRRRGITPPSK